MVNMGNIVLIYRPLVLPTLLKHQYFSGMLFGSHLPLKIKKAVPTCCGLPCLTDIKGFVLLSVQSRNNIYFRWYMLFVRFHQSVDFDM